MEDSFGERLSHVMNVRCMRQKELAKAVNVTEATVSRYVNNLRVPDIAFIRSVVKLLDVSADYLLGFSDDMQLGGKKERQFKYRLMCQDGQCIGISDQSQIELLDAFFDQLQ